MFNFESFLKYFESYKASYYGGDELIVKDDEIEYKSETKNGLYKSKDINDKNSIQNNIQENQDKSDKIVIDAEKEKDK